jgi:hypothetical protein
MAQAVKDVRPQVADAGGNEGGEAAVGFCLKLSALPKTSATVAGAAGDRDFL